MNEALPNFELRLREALAPVEPPADLVERVEGALEAITELAAGELEAWELSAMRDPRNWARPAAAVVAGSAAGAAAGKVFAEVAALARTRGASEQTFNGLAGAGDLVATVLADGSRNRRAGELLGSGLSAVEIAPRIGQTAEALDALPVLAGLLREAHVDAPATTSLAAVVEGRIPPERWIEQLSARRHAA